MNRFLPFIITAIVSITLTLILHDLFTPKKDKCDIYTVDIKKIVNTYEIYALTKKSRTDINKDTNIFFNKFTDLLKHYNKPVIVRDAVLVIPELSCDITDNMIRELLPDFEKTKQTDNRRTE